MAGTTPSLRVVFLGDSLTQGTQDGYTTRARQAHGYAQVVSSALGLEPNAAYIDSPGIPLEVFNGSTYDAHALHDKTERAKAALAPSALATWLKDRDKGTPRLLKVAGQGQRSARSRDIADHPQNNFAVPGFRARHLAGIHDDRDMVAEVHSGLMPVEALAEEVPLTRAVLQDGQGQVEGSSLEQAIRARPDIAVVWAGANDTLHPLRAGYVDDALLTPLHDQPYRYWVENPVTHSMVQRTTEESLPGYESTWLGPGGVMDRLLHETDAEVFLLTIPQAGVTPCFRTLGKPLGPLPFTVRLEDGTDVTSQVEKWTIPSGVRNPDPGARTVFPPSTKVFLFSALDALLDKGKIKTAAQFAERLQTASNPVFTEDQVADPDEQAQVEQRTNEFNDVLKRAVQLSPRVHLVDANQVLLDAQDHGRDLQGQGPDVRITTTFTGVKRDGMEGMFSYDGLHPSDTGHAIIANEVLNRMRQEVGDQPRFAALQQVPSVDEKAIMAQDPHYLNRHSST